MKRFILLATLSNSAISFAHADLKQHIHALSAQIHANADYELILERAKNYAQLKKWRRSLIDIETAQQLGAPIELIHIARAQIYIESNKIPQARRSLESLLKSNDLAPKQLVQAFLLKAAYYKKNKQYSDALKAYQDAQSLDLTPDPEIYLEMLSLAEKAKKSSEWMLTFLNEAMEHLGYVPALFEITIQKLLANGQELKALALLEKKLAQSPRQESLLIKKAAIQIRLKNYPQAHATLTKAQNEISLLPEHIRSSHATQQIQSSLNMYLVQIKGIL